MHFQEKSLISENLVRAPHSSLDSYAPVDVSLRVVVQFHLFLAGLLTCRARLFCVRVSVFDGRPGGPEELAKVWTQTYLNIHTAMYEAYG